MSGRDALRALAARVEALPGPDRKVDGLIFRAVTRGGVWHDFDGVLHLRDEADTIAWEPPPAYTASLDAALMLVPEGWRVSTADWSIPGRFSWMLTGPRKHYVTTPDGHQEAGDDWFRAATARTPALALCAAALRALAEGRE